MPDLKFCANPTALLAAKLKEITKAALLYMAILSRYFLKIEDFKIRHHAV